MTIIDRIDDNISLAGTPEVIDHVNSGFYSRFPFPWRPSSIDCTSDPDFARIALNQNLGDWTHQMVPTRPYIWIAGCGTNQAAITALHFPNAVVRGSDISDKSLECCSVIARDINVNNLELCRESINQVSYSEKFDYIISTGVIHHNADPEATLKKLAAALKPTGVLELMVYNRYHRILTSAFQKGVRALASTESTLDYEKELSITKALINEFPGEGLMRQYLGLFKRAPDAQLADAFMQPVENSYTVEVLEEMVHRCGLEFLAPAPNAWDKGYGNVTWNVRFIQPEIQHSYDELPDSRRWQITNLLLCENSPMLWFYLKRADNPAKRKSEREICDSFLETHFQPNAVIRRSYVATRGNKFMESKLPLPYPGLPASPELRRVVEAVDGGVPMSHALESLRIPRNFSTVNDLRLRLTTSAGPFLRSIN
jgi:SAM-dependent methyltransferase